MSGTRTHRMLHDSKVIGFFYIKMMIRRDIIDYLEIIVMRGDSSFHLPNRVWRLPFYLFIYFKHFPKDQIMTMHYHWLDAAKVTKATLFSSLTP